MKKSGSRLLSMLLAFALILSSLSSLAFAATEEQPANGANLALNKTTTASGTEASFIPKTPRTAIWEPAGPMTESAPTRRDG